MLAKEQCEELMGNLFPFAEEQLKKHHEFYPFGAVMLEDGTVEFTAGYDENEFPDSKEVIEKLSQHHKKMAIEGKIKASGIVWNSSVVTEGGKPADAIIVSLEHVDNYSVIVGEPYKIGLFKKVVFGELFAMEGQHNIF